MFQRNHGDLTRGSSGLTLLLIFSLVNHGFAQSQILEADDEQGAADMVPGLPKFNLDIPTLGGRQFWGDVSFFRGYRIQQNVLTSHYRLLDPTDTRRAWGTREECQASLDQIRQEQQLAPMSGKAVILIHGIIRSSKSFSTLAGTLADEGYTVVGFDYPSTRTPLIASAAYLQQTIASLEGIEQIDLVVHSMGGLLVRTYLMQAQAQQGRDPRLNRMVMLGVPNQGAKMANLFQNNWLFQMAYGPAGQQLVESPEGFISKLPSPDFDFAIISGARGNADGWNPLIPGDDDGTVSVESTRLPGAADTIELSTLHSSMMWNPEVMKATTLFLKTGSLRLDGTRSPSPLPSEAPDSPEDPSPQSD